MRADEIRNMIGSPQGVEMRGLGCTQRDLISTKSSSDEQENVPPLFAAAASSVDQDSHPVPRPPNGNPNPSLANSIGSRSSNNNDVSHRYRGVSARRTGTHFASNEQHNHTPLLPAAISNESEESTPPTFHQFPNSQTTSPRALRPPMSTRTPTSGHSAGSRGSGVASLYSGRHQGPKLSYGSSSFNSSRQQLAPHEVRSRLSSGSAFSRCTSPSNLPPTIAVGVTSPRSRLSTGSYQPFAGQRLSDVPHGVDSPSMAQQPSAARNQPDYDTGSESDTSSVKEPFTDQVDSLNRLLTSPDRGLGPLAQTNFSPGAEDDSLGDEMKELESSHLELQKELSAIDFSTLVASPDNSSQEHVNGTPQSKKSTKSKASYSKSSQSSEKTTPSPLSSSITNAFGFFRRASKRLRSTDYVGLTGEKHAAIVRDDDGGSSASRHSERSDVSSRSKISIASSLHNESAPERHAFTFSNANNDPVPSPKRTSKNRDFYGDNPSNASARFLAAVEGRPDLPEFVSCSSPPAQVGDLDMTALTRQKQTPIRASSLDSQNQLRLMFPYDELTPRPDAGMLPNLSSQSDETKFFQDFGSPETKGTPRKVDHGAIPIHVIGSFDGNGGGMSPPLLVMDADYAEEEEEVVFETTERFLANDLDRQLPVPDAFEKNEEKNPNGSLADEHAYGLDKCYGQCYGHKKKAPTSNLDRQLPVPDTLEKNEERNPSGSLVDEHAYGLDKCYGQYYGHKKKAPTSNLDRQLPVPDTLEKNEERNPSGSLVDEHAYGLDIYYSHCYRHNEKAPTSNLDRQLPVPDMLDKNEERNPNGSLVDEHAYGLDIMYYKREVDLEALEAHNRAMSGGLNVGESGEEGEVSFDFSNIPTWYSSEKHNTATEEVKSKSSDSISTIRKRRNRWNVCVSVLILLICCGCVFGIFYALTVARADGDDDNPIAGGGADDKIPITPSLSSSPSAVPSINPTATVSPSSSHSPTTTPTRTPQPTTTFVPSFLPSSYPSTNPTLQPSSPPSTIIQSTNPTSQPSSSPTKTIRPSMSPMSPSSSPTINILPSVSPTTSQPSSSPSIYILPSMSPTTSQPSSLPSINIVAFEVIYNIIVQHGLEDSIPSDVYHPELIESMDRLTLEVDRTLNEETRRRLSSVILPSTIKASSEVICTIPNGMDRCERVIAEVNLRDAEDDWQDFKILLDLAIQIGRLQYYLDEVDPNSVVEILDRSNNDRSPTPSEAPIAISSDHPTVTPGPTSYSLFMFLIDNSFDGGAALRNLTSPQYQAFTWLSGNAMIDEYSSDQILQRYAMATLYYSTNGENWFFNDGWLSDDDECDWYNRAGRRACHSQGQLKSLELDYNNLNGELPKELGYLTELERFILRGGPSSYTAGRIPSELGYCTRMNLFFIQNNAFSGEIPDFFSQMSQLEQVDLSQNQFTGSLPQLSVLTDLRFLNLGYNLFTGPIPDISPLRRLQSLIFENNFLTDLPPPPNKLQVLLGGMNLLTSIPPELGQLTFCDTIALNNNLLQSTIPRSLGDLPRIRLLDLSGNSITGSIPSELGNLGRSRAHRIDLSYNLIEGTIPASFGRLGMLRILSLQSNRLSGNLPSEISDLRRLTTFQLDSNDMTGTIPEEVCETFNSTRPAFRADCTDFQDQCPCCTSCCTPTGCECRYVGTDLDYLCFQQKS